MKSKFNIRASGIVYFLSKHDNWEIHCFATKKGKNQSRNAKVFKYKSDGKSK